MTESIYTFKNRVIKMGIYFDYDLENGKEVENWTTCFLCDEKKVLFVEYHVKKGPVYTLYDNARKLYSGREVKLASSKYHICDDCFSRYPSEEEVISAILKRRKEKNIVTNSEEDYDPLKILEEEIEEEKRELAKRVEKIGHLYARLEKERIKRQKIKNN